MLYIMSSLIIIFLIVPLLCQFIMSSFAPCPSIFPVANRFPVGPFLLYVQKCELLLLMVVSNFLFAPKIVDLIRLL